MNVRLGFSIPAVHGLAYKDDFWPRASEVRGELLAYPDWREMAQGNRYSDDIVAPHRQNGITTGHIDTAGPVSLVESLAFQRYLLEHAPALCELVGADASEVHSIEMNGMAYGEGAWLSPHTDKSDGDDSRIAAWMLYLTHPDDGEWGRSLGGAVRLVGPRGAETKLAPKFNRFAIFRVGNDSVHEVEKVVWAPPWDRCRLALSGWIRGKAPGRDTRVYLLSADFAKRRERMTRDLSGSLALYRLLEQQRAYANLDTGSVAARVGHLSKSEQAHRDAPAGTSFVRFVAGPAWCIVVTDEQENVVYFGPAKGYPVP